MVRPTQRTLSEFHFTDHQPLDGAAYYRLKVMGKTGHVQYCKVVSQTLMASANMNR